MLCFECNFIEYKMYDIINKFLLSGDKFMSEMRLRNLNLTTVLVEH